MTTQVHVWVPATSANLGPGFDTLGLALHNELTLGKSDHVMVSINGEGAVSSPSTVTISSCARRALFLSMTQRTVVGVGFSYNSLSKDTRSSGARGSPTPTSSRWTVVMMTQPNGPSRVRCRGSRGAAGPGETPAAPAEVASIVCHYSEFRQAPSLEDFSLRLTEYRGLVVGLLLVAFVVAFPGGLAGTASRLASRWSRPARA